MNKLLYCVVFLIIAISCAKTNEGSDFSYNLIPVETEGKWGYIDNEGNYVINPQFTVAQLFSEDLAIVGNEDSLLGYVDKKGNYVIKPEFLWATNFREGLAFTTKRNGFITCIDNKGKIQFILNEAESASEFSENLALVNVADKFGFIDKNGKYIIKPQFDYASSFKEGLAVVGKYNKNSDLSSNLSDMIFGFIDKEGRLKINYQFKTAESFSEGLATVSIEDNKYGIIDKEGKYILTPKYGHILSYKQGLAAFNLSQDGGVSNNRGFLDKNGNIIINPQYNESGNFNNSLAPVRSGSSFGYINENGKVMINPQFEAASDFFSDIAAVKIGQKIGFINRKGEYVVPPQFNSTFSSALDVILYFNGLYRGNFDYVLKDYYNPDVIVKELFKDSDKNGLFRLYKRKKLIDVVDENLFKNLKYGNNNGEYFEIVNVDISSQDLLSDNIDSTNVSPVNDFLVAKVVMNFERNKSTFLVTDSMLEAVEIYLDLYNNALNKDDVIAEKIKFELKKRYGIKTNYDSHSKSLKTIDAKNLKMSIHFNSVENTFD